MSSEKFNPSGERAQPNAEIAASGKEKLAELTAARADQDPLEHSERRADKAREIISRQEPEPADQAEAQPQAPQRPTPLLDHHLNYAQTLASVQRKLRPASRSFSKVIHAPLVEKTTEAMEATVARPSVLLGSTWTALIIGTIFYLTARHYGYSLSGSELLFSFIVGALLGLVLEGFWRALKRR